MTYDYSFKLTMVGDSSVGKTSIIKQYIYDIFTDREPTIGIDFGAKMIKICDKNIKLFIWDTAGQEAFRSITRSYYNYSAGVILVFDVTNINSFNHVRNWLEEIRLYARDHIKIILVGNKIDKPNRQIDYNMANIFANNHGLQYIETSALLKQNIDELFRMIAVLIHNSIKTNEILPIGYNNGIGISNTMLNTDTYYCCY